MFFDFSSWGLLTNLLFFITIIYFIFFAGRRKRSSRRKGSYSSSSVSQPGKTALYPAGMKIHQTYDIMRRELRKENKRRLDREEYLISGDYIRSTEREKEVFINTVMNFVGNTIFMYMVYDYDGLKDGSALPENINIIIDTQTIRAITVYQSGNAVYMRLKLDDPELPEEMLFEFNGPDGTARAEEVRRRILAARDSPYETVD